MGLDGLKISEKCISDNKKFYKNFLFIYKRCDLFQSSVISSMGHIQDCMANAVVDKGTMTTRLIDGNTNAGYVTDDAKIANVHNGAATMNAQCRMTYTYIIYFLYVIVTHYKTYENKRVY